MTLPALYFIINVKLTAFDHRGLEDLFAIRVFLVRIEREIWVDYLLRHLGMIEGKLKLDFQLGGILLGGFRAQDLGGSLILVAIPFLNLRACPGKVIIGRLP